MGIIRKTLSVGTLGFINFRSKAELVERAESERDKAESRNEALSEDAQRMAHRAHKADKRARKAELRLLAADKKSKRRKRHRILDHVPGDSATLADTSRAARRKAKKVARRARKAAGGS